MQCKKIQLESLEIGKLRIQLGVTWYGGGKERRGTEGSMWVSWGWSIYYRVVPSLRLSFTCLACTDLCGDDLLYDVHALNLPYGVHALNLLYDVHALIDLT